MLPYVITISEVVKVSCAFSQSLTAHLLTKHENFGEWWSGLLEKVSFSAQATVTAQ